MKKILLIFIATIGTFHIQAQNINPDNDNVPHNNTMACAAFNKDNLLSRWCIDVNAIGGILTQQITSGDPSANYKNALSPNISNLKFDDGATYGFDAQIAYFFDHRRHFGIGAGLLYMYQQGSMTMDNFDIQYRSVDKFGNTFRQIVSSNGQIKENLDISNFNIPLLLKYKTRCSKTIGFTADAGLLFNLQEKNTYHTNASFDYEAIYDYAENGTTVYDNAAVPGSSDLLITKSRYGNTHSSSDIRNYFNTLRNDGYNVGLGVKPDNNSGHVSYYTGSVGLLIRPAISFYLSDNVALNLGAYYIYQNFTNAPANSMLTDKAGSYNSMLGNVTRSVNNSYGISFGIRFFLCHPKKAAVDVVPVTPEEVEPEVTKTPPAAQEETEEVPEVADISAPVYFNVNRSTIEPQYFPILDEAAKEANEGANVQLIIHGYADNTGNALYNVALSKKRALAVKSYLRKKGVNARSLKTVAHGSKSPAASNKTEEGRAKNRRVIVKMKQE